MKYFKHLLTMSIVVSTIVSCKKDELGPIDNIQGLGGDTWVAGAIDKWISDSLTVPYNITVKYKWDQSELPLNYVLVPPAEEKIIPVMSSIKKVWLDNYAAETSTMFIKQFAPKFFNLIGSPGFNPNGSILLGTAEGGRKVNLYDINRFRIKGMAGYNAAADTGRVVQMFHTIDHEFAHILDQNIAIPIAFSSGSVNLYSPDWTNITPTEARNDGFITPYGQSQKGEDWAEMVATMLVEGKAYFDNYVNSINYTGTTPAGTTAAQAQARLRQKEASVVSYFKQSYNIDFYSLQARTRVAINALLY